MFEPDSSELDRFLVVRSSCCRLLCSLFPWFSFVLCFSYYRPWTCTHIPYPQEAGLYSLQVSPHADIFKLWSLNPENALLSYPDKQPSSTYSFTIAFRENNTCPRSSVITLPSSCQAFNRKTLPTHLTTSRKQSTSYITPQLFSTTYLQPSREEMAVPMTPYHPMWGDISMLLS